MLILIGIGIALSAYVTFAISLGYMFSSVERERSGSSELEPRQNSSSVKRESKPFERLSKL
jgi:hypothetical protein